jgi:hypothetical protein
MYNDHPWDPKIVTIVGRWSLLRGCFCEYGTSNWLSLYTDGLYVDMVFNSRFDCTTEKLHVTLSYEKSAHKMLMKLTPSWNRFCG